MIIIIAFAIATAIVLMVVMVDIYNRCPMCKRFYRGKITSTRCGGRYVTYTYKCKKCGHVWKQQRNELPPG